MSSFAPVDNKKIIELDRLVESGKILLCLYVLYLCREKIDSFEILLTEDEDSRDVGTM